MKKIISLVLLTVFLLTVATACSTARSQTSSTGSSGKIEFEFYHGVGGDMAGHMEDIINDYNASQDKYFCKSVYFASYPEEMQGFQAALAAKTPPALTFSCLNLKTVQKGLFAEVTPLANEDPNFTWEDYLEGAVAGCTFDGRMIGLPYSGSGWLVYYDKNKVAELNLDPDVIFADWESVGKMAAEVTKKEANGDVYWGFEPMWWADLLFRAAVSNGGKFVSEDGKTALVNTKEWVDCWEMFRKWIHEDEIMRIHHGGQGWEAWYKTMDDVHEGRALAFTGTMGDLGVLDWEKIGVHVMPGFSGVGPWRGSTSRGGLGITASAPEEQQRAAFDFYKFLTSPENNAKWTIKTGYTPINKKAVEVPAYIDFLKEAPYMEVAFESLETAIPAFDDPTNGRIEDALKKAFDQVMIEGISAQQALDEAAATIQAELDLL